MNGLHLTFALGASRAVFCSGQIAIKFARHDIGARCNLDEADQYHRRAKPERRAFLCPVLWCSVNGAVLAMQRARPMTESEHAELLGTDRLPKWDYHPPDDEESPLEEVKASMWGWLGEQIVAVDYAVDPELKDLLQLT